MKTCREVANELIVMERAAWWNPRLRRILKAAPLVVMFLLLNTRTARAACSFSPSPDPTVDDASNSLRAAILAANASGQDCLIQLQAGTYTLTIANPTTGPNQGQDNTGAYGDLDITDRGHTVTILGKGHKVSIVNANGIDRAFQVLNGANAAFGNLAIEGGSAVDNGTAHSLPGQTTSEGGGVLVQNGGHVSFSNVAIDGNFAFGAPGLNGTPPFNPGPGLAGQGGGLFLSSGTVELTDSEVSGNGAGGGMGGTSFLTSRGANGGAGGAGAGGGLYVLSGNLRLLRSRVFSNRAGGGMGGRGFFSGNSGGGQGGGIFLASGALRISGTTISANSAVDAGNFSLAGGVGSGAGGGIFVASGSVKVTDSTLFSNGATGGSAGLTTTNSGSAAGGGLYLGGGSVSLAADTVASNFAEVRAFSVTASGGGIANAGSGLFTNTTLIGNNNLFSINTLPLGSDVEGPITCANSLISQIAGTTITDHGGNLFDVDPVLDPGGLKFNGGTTETVALESGSPAIDAVPAAHCTDLDAPPNPVIIDQRGFPRPDIGEVKCDIGAYEVQDTAFLRFSLFNGRLKIDPDAGVFDLAGGFTLGTGGSIDPTTQPVAFSEGSYAVRLPAGSFVKNSSGYVYQKLVNGISLSVSINFTSQPGAYQLLASRAGGTLTDTSPPLPVTLMVGNNIGTTDMRVRFY